MSEVRLIDAEALKKKIYDEFNSFEELTFTDFIRLLNDTPTLPNPCGNPCNFIGSKDDLIKAYELLKAYCKDRECNEDCIFYRELRIGDNIDHKYCGLCEIVASDNEEAENGSKEV